MKSREYPMPQEEFLNINNMQIASLTIIIYLRASDTYFRQGNEGINPIILLSAPSGDVHGWRSS